MYPVQLFIYNRLTGHLSYDGLMVVQSNSFYSHSNEYMKWQTKRSINTDLYHKSSFLGSLFLAVQYMLTQG